MKVLAAFFASIGYLAFPGILVFAWPHLFGLFYVVAILAAIWGFFRYDDFVEEYFDQCQRSDY